jgi:hypothetical protein
MPFLNPVAVSFRFTFLATPMMQLQASASDSSKIFQAVSIVSVGTSITCQLLGLRIGDASLLDIDTTNGCSAMPRGKRFAAFLE